MLTWIKNYWLSLIIGLLFFPSTLVAQTSANPNTNYKITYWSTDEGLPGNAIIKIFQDSDGYLWLGSFDGLVRFDGTRFITYNKNNLLVSNYALAITGDQHGNLWVGTDQGIIHHKKGKITPLIDPDHSIHIESLFFDEANQKLWIGARNAGLFTYDLTTQKYTQASDLKNDIVNDILKDHDGSMWIATEKIGLVQYKNEEWKTFTKDDGLLSTEIKTLHQDEDGVLYVGTTSGLYIRKPGEKFVEQKKFSGIRINKVIDDKKGNLWIGTVNGLYHRPLKTEDWKILTREDGLSNNDIREIYFDSEGSIWLGTYRGGLNQLRETKFSTYFSKGGPVIEATGAVCELDEKTLLIGTTEGKLFTLKDNQVRPYPTKTTIKQRIYSIHLDDRENIWIVSYDGLLLITADGREKLFTEKDGLLTKQIRVIFQDKNGMYWIGSRNAGLLKMSFTHYPDKPSFEQSMFKELSDVNSTFIMDINQDSKGNFLISTNNGGLTILGTDGKISNFNKQNGLESKTCFVSRPDQFDNIWITTTNGLTRIKNGKAFTFSKKDGMPHENPMDVIDDGLGFFWLPTQKGTIRVSQQQLNDYADGKVKTIEWKLFDKNNDLEKTECTGTARALKTTDGKIWFPMIGGLMSVDPSSIQISKKIPKIYIEKVTIDDREVDSNTPITVRAGSHRIAFDYIALTLLYPNSALYKYKLNNFDGNWIDAGVSRKATYTSLPPGEYTFSVIGCNSDGVWNETGATVPIIVKPHIYQTWWFITVAILLLLATILAYIRIRTESIKQKSKYLENLVKERTRLIAEQRDELVALNEELRSSQEEVLAQRDVLAGKIEELAEKNEEIAQINSNLEKIVEQRTKVLEEQNQRISEYAFINAHKLRAPLASLLGIINLMNYEATNDAQRTLNKHLLKSADSLDEVVRSINQMLEGEFHAELKRFESDDDSKPEQDSDKSKQ